MGTRTMLRNFLIARLTRSDQLTAIVLVVAVAGLTGKLTAAHAEPVCIAITAEVRFVHDFGGFLDGAIEEGDVITGRYDYDSTTPDTNPSPMIGHYTYMTPPYGITLNAGGVRFRTDPTNVNLLIEILNGYDTPPRDVYFLTSYNNVFDKSVPSSPRPPDNIIYWQLEDPTTTAISSDALPATPPILADWPPSFFGLTIMSNNGVDSFLIRADVMSAKLCSNPPVEGVLICHKPGTPAQETLFIPQGALAGHLRHGDALAECP